MVGKEAALQALRDGRTLEQVAGRRIAELEAENERLRGRLQAAEVDGESTGATTDRDPELSESTRRRLGPNLLKVAAAMRLPGRGTGASPAQSRPRRQGRSYQGRQLTPGQERFAENMKRQRIGRRRTSDA